MGNKITRVNCIVVECGGDTDIRYGRLFDLLRISRFMPSASWDYVAVSYAFDNLWHCIRQYCYLWKVWIITSAYPPKTLHPQTHHSPYLGYLFQYCIHKNDYVFMINLNHRDRVTILSRSQCVKLYWGFMCNMYHSAIPCEARLFVFCFLSFSCSLPKQ